MYTPISGFSTELTSYLPADSAFFPVSRLVRFWLLEKLPDRGYCYLILVDGNAAEVVKLENYCNTLIIYRGRMGTKPLSFPCGAKAQYIITPHTIEQLACAIDDCKDNLMPYTALVSFSVNTTGKLADIDTDLPIADDKLSIMLTNLPEGAHTYLSVCDGFNTEIIKATNMYGRINVERGQELTEARTFPVGSVIEYIMTPTAIREIVCQMDCCP